MQSKARRAECTRLLAHEVSIVVVILYVPGATVVVAIPGNGKGLRLLKVSWVIPSYVEELDGTSPLFEGSLAR